MNGKEINRLERSSTVSVEEQLKQMSLEKLWLQMHRINDELGQIGITTSIGEIFYAAIAHGYQYEDRRHPKTRVNVIPTPINVLAVIVHNQPEIRTQTKVAQFEQVMTLCSEMAMTVEQISARLSGSWNWSKAFLMDPTKAHELYNRGAISEFNNA